MTITRFGMTPEAIKELVNRCVEEELAAYEEARAANALEAENQSQNGSDGDNGNGGNGNGGNGNGENGNGGNGNGGNGNPNENDRDASVPYQQLSREIPSQVCYLPQASIKTTVTFKHCLTWWNLHKRTIGAEAAFSMSWRELLKLMTEVYCPRNKIQKMESELWNLTVKNNDLAAYTKRFQELTMM
ncbi:putative reverse transcriptase domain-containing protein [Tanacetum coccineum]